MSIAMTQQQEKEFDEIGFIILDDFLSRDELARLLSAVDEVAAKIRQSEGLSPNDPFAIRNALGNLKSTFFTFTIGYDTARRIERLGIHGAGFGHGVGLCQMGSQAMARESYNYRQILAHYYVGVKMRKLYQ